jgi:hypothetical protein
LRCLVDKLSAVVVASVLCLLVGSNASAAPAKPLNVNPPQCIPQTQTQVWPNGEIWTWFYDHTDFQYPYETLWFKWQSSFGAPGYWEWAECGRTIPPLLAAK